MNKFEPNERHAVRLEDFEPNAPGRFAQSFDGHRTFVPNPLPPALQYDPVLVGLLSEADLALQRYAFHKVLL